MEEITKQIRILQKENEELKVIRESNNEELIRLESEVMMLKRTSGKGSFEVDEL